jgi:hypothetical protein
LLSEAQGEERELMFWHVTKGLKAAVKNKHTEVLRYVIDDLRLSLDHEAFQKYLHLFLFGCQDAEFEADPAKKEEARALNREMLKLLVKGKGRSAIDEIDNTNSSTPLMMACESLSDVEIVRILVVEGGADVNSINNDDKMPLSLVKERIDRMEASGVDEAASSAELLAEHARLKEIY